jgi:hypothetical protein
MTASQSGTLPPSAAARCPIQRRHLASLILRLGCTPFEIFGKWSDQFLGFRNHEISVRCSSPEPLANRSTHDCKYSVGTTPRQYDE